MRIYIYLRPLSTSSLYFLSLYTSCLLRARFLALSCALSCASSPYDAIPSIIYFTSTLQHTATHCNTLQHTITHCNTPQHTATHCNTPQHTARHCNTLQHTATHRNTLQRTATHCNTLQHTATHCNTLHHTATHCNSLQHTATHCDTPQHTGETDGDGSFESNTYFLNEARNLKPNIRLDPRVSKDLKGRRLEWVVVHPIPKGHELVWEYDRTLQFS